MEYEQIILRYEGLEASESRVDLAQIGQSLQGAAQLLGTAASIVATGEYAKRSSAMPVKILAGIPRAGSWEIPAIIMSTAPVAVGQFDMFSEIGKQMASKATTRIVNYVISTFEPRPKSDLALSMETVQKSMAELGHTSRHAMDSIVRMAEQQRPAARALVAPVGRSCDTMQVGDHTQGAITIDRELRAAIEAPIEIDVQTSRHHEILISEMDRVNQSCKFAFRNDENPDRRISGEITDPIIQSPNDPYSAAFSSQRWINVVGKLQIKGGSPDRLFISDIVS